MYKITDRVELGHFPLTGGSVEISIELEKIPNKEEKERILNAIDKLDHCLISTNEELVDLSQRYFLLDETKTIFEDIHTVLFSILKNNYNCTVTLGKESYMDKLKEYSKIIKSYIKE